MRRPAFILGVCVLMASLVACSGGSDGGSGSESAKTDLSASVASYDLAVGPPSRITVGLQTEDTGVGSKLISYGTVALRFSYLGTREQPTASTVFGQPVTANFLPLPASPMPSPPPAQPRIVPSTEARGVYATEAAFDKAGFWGVQVEAEIDGTTHRGRSIFPVEAQHKVPAPGDPAPATKTLTVSSTDVPKAAIDSRAGDSGEIPDPELHQKMLADSLAAGRPAVVVFSTPVFCVSQFCGPVTDMVDELSRTYSDRADFIHVEVWKDGQKREVNDAMKEWKMETEPWVFLIGADGKIVLRLDNVATRAELEPYLQQLPIIAPQA
ncbi:MAG TPA: hypothetical protein VM121_02025 [Acidimicrobiales bacterium]|nr:hypothetical protein [Acidimicrobiales bacterium]